MITVRPEMPGDEDAIRQVNLRAFGRDLEGKRVDLIRGSRFWVPGLSMVALDGDNIVGHVLLSAAMLVNDHEAMSILSLVPVSVLPEYQGRGIGTKMIQCALESAKSTDFPAVVVMGHPGYYQRFGFIKASNKGIYAPFTVPEEVYMVLELIPNALDKVTGTVRYPPCFSAL